MGLGDGIATIDAQVCTGHIAAGVGEEVGDRAHEIFRLAHLAHGNKRGPVLVEFGVLIENLLGPK